MPSAQTSTERRFVFHGNAIPVGGRVWRIRDDRTPLAVNSPPASSLAVVGGFCHAESPGSTFKDVFQWGKCVAESSGAANADNSRVTTVTASVENVTATNPPIVFKAGLLRIAIVSNHPETGQPSIAPKEVVFGGPGGMTFNKKKVTVEVDLDDFQKMPTLETFENAFRTDRKIFKKYRDRFYRGKRRLPQFGEPIPRIASGYAVSSIVASVQWGDTKYPGNVLKQEGFGSIYFGEVLINEYNRRFTLVRLAMGSDVEAEAAFAEVDPNGSWVS